MKKRILGLFAIALITIAAWNYNQNNEVKFVDLYLNNVEALASGESGRYCNYPGGGCIIKYSDGSSTYIPDRWN